MIDTIRWKLLIRSLLITSVDVRDADLVCP